MPSTMSAPAPRVRQSSDLEQLQGAWKTIAGRREARLLVVEGRFTFEFLDGEGEIYMGTFVVEPDVYPRRMDMQIEEGPQQYRGQPSFCIYHLEGDVLRWCPTKPGAGVRLTQFPSVDDDKYLSLVFKHVRPHR
jgi:uncharacterized protein (TIGR03067 family)